MSVSCSEDEVEESNGNAPIDAEFAPKKEDKREVHLLTLYSVNIAGFNSCLSGD